MIFPDWGRFSSDSALRRVAYNPLSSYPQYPVSFYNVQVGPGVMLRGSRNSALPDTLALLIGGEPAAGQNRRGETAPALCTRKSGNTCCIRHFG
ncbi:hypothetical protein EVAR_16761_1 [Eumeta japonica]|uniref:Uncharacterized protein n=1 Tax=Eumeta variegata TaxID=151549 RepID=A0A4C1UM89_EUMVA|nr:hypothetical protein EVAR_16761_1 [Eumeta japonica]